jgi:maleate cis-trans isomerase
VTEELERELGRPVITSNQAAIWWSLRAIGIYEEVKGLGALLRHDAKTSAAAAA